MAEIVLTGTVTDDGLLVARMPYGSPPGKYRVLVISQTAQPEEPVTTTTPLGFTAWPWDAFPREHTYRREDMYGDDGR
jgi:hypothetical protein